MPSKKSPNNEAERPIPIWLIQFCLLIMCLGLLFSIGLSFHFCATTVSETCWSRSSIIPILLGISLLAIQVWLLYGLEKGLPYARWLIGILMIAGAAISIENMNYLQLIFRPMEPGKGLHTPPYDC
ncbi:MAG: hypothetical protein AAGA83_04835 [Cyanobacteria bacterium P01_F01_bin.116]